MGALERDFARGNAREGTREMERAREVRAEDDDDDDDDARETDGSARVESGDARR